MQGRAILLQWRRLPGSHGLFLAPVLAVYSKWRFILLMKLPKMTKFPTLPATIGECLLLAQSGLRIQRDHCIVISKHTCTVRLHIHTYVHVHVRNILREKSAANRRMHCDIFVAVLYIIIYIMYGHRMNVHVASHPGNYTVAKWTVCKVQQACYFSSMWRLGHLEKEK